MLKVMTGKELDDWWSSLDWEMKGSVKSYCDGSTKTNISFGEGKKCPNCSSIQTHLVWKNNPASYFRKCRNCKNDFDINSLE